jgi:hypothetical protein
MQISVLITPCHFYIDPGKFWSMVKPIAPNRPAFFVYQTIRANLRDFYPENEIKTQIMTKLNLSPECTLVVQELEPSMFVEHLSEEDKKLEINPKPKYDENYDHGQGD